MPRYVANVNKSYKGCGGFRELINPQTHIFALSLNSFCVYFLITISSCNFLHNTLQVRTYSCQTRSPIACLSLFIAFCLFGSNTAHPLDTKIQNLQAKALFFQFPKIIVQSDSHLTSESEPLSLSFETAIGMWYLNGLLGHLNLCSCVLLFEL